MKIVIDTNILVSAVYFGGYPGKIVEAVIDGSLDSFASEEVIEEYHMIVEGFRERKAGHFNRELFLSYMDIVKTIEPEEVIEICRDPDDNKFLECASAAKAMYIVSGDKDLLVLTRYKDIEIITAKAFCERYL